MMSAVQHRADGDGGVLGHLDFQATARQVHAQQIEQRAVVVHDQDARCGHEFTAAN